MIKAIFFSSFSLAICVILQSTLLHNIAILGVIPDLSLIALLFSSVKNGSMEGQIIGFSGGLVEDFLSLNPLGTHALVKTVIGFASGFLYGNFFIDSFLFPAILGFAATIGKALLVFFLSLFFPLHISSYDFFDRIIWIEALYNGMLSPVLFLFLNLFKKFLVVRRNRI
jgi:rod shape-determining protein MreD